MALVPRDTAVLPLQLSSHFHTKCLRQFLSQNQRRAERNLKYRAKHVKRRHGRSGARVAAPCFWLVKSAFFESSRSPPVGCSLAHGALTQVAAFASTPRPPHHRSPTKSALQMFHRKLWCPTKASILVQLKPGVRGLRGSSLKSCTGTAQLPLKMPQIFT